MAHLKLCSPFTFFIQSLTVRLTVGQYIIHYGMNDGLFLTVYKSSNQIIYKSNNRSRQILLIIDVFYSKG